MLYSDTISYEYLDQPITNLCYHSNIQNYKHYKYVGNSPKTFALKIMLTVADLSGHLYDFQS